MANSAWWKASIQAWIAMLNEVQPPLPVEFKARMLGAFITAMLGRDTFES